MLWGIVVLARQDRNVHHAVAGIAALEHTGRGPASPHSVRLTFIVEMLNPDWPKTSNVLYSGCQRCTKVSVSSLITYIQTHTHKALGGTHRYHMKRSAVSSREKKNRGLGLQCWGWITLHNHRRSQQPFAGWVSQITVKCSRSLYVFLYSKTSYQNTT